MNTNSRDHPWRLAAVNFLLLLQLPLLLLLQVHLHRDKVTWPGAKIQKPGEGMPNYENNKIRGTLYITVDVKFPKKAFSEEDSEGDLVSCLPPSASLPLVCVPLFLVLFDLLKLGCPCRGVRYTGPVFLAFLPLPLSLFPLLLPLSLRSFLQRFLLSSFSFFFF